MKKWQKKRDARTGRNPQTGEEVKIAARVVPGFKAGNKLKDALNLYKYYRDNYNYQTIIKSKEIIYYLKSRMIL